MVQQKRKHWLESLYRFADLNVMTMTAGTTFQRSFEFALHLAKQLDQSTNTTVSLSLHCKLGNELVCRTDLGQAL
jgi:hypothetical protein